MFRGLTTDQLKRGRLKVIWSRGSDPVFHRLVESSATRWAWISIHGGTSLTPGKPMSLEELFLATENLKAFRVEWLDDATEKLEPEDLFALVLRGRAILTDRHTATIRASWKRNGERFEIYGKRI